jgi:hypothetical protein
MGKLFSKSRRTPKDVTTVEPPPPVKTADHGLQRMQKTFNEDLETFLLNNVLLCVQFFEDFER